MPGLPFAHCCSFSTVITFLRFAPQIFFCYREKVIHFLTIELYLYNQHYDLVFKVTVFSTCLSWYRANTSLLVTDNMELSRVERAHFRDYELSYKPMFENQLGAFHQARELKFICCILDEEDENEQRSQAVENNGSDC